MRHSSVLPFVVGSILSASASAQAVSVVGAQPGPGIDFTSIASAVAAAAEGETILVRAGDYQESVTITGRSLAIAADPQGAAVRLVGRLGVQQLSASQFASIAGLHVDANLMGDGLQAVAIDDSLGHVWLEGCRIEGPDAASALQSPGPGLLAENAAHVTLVRCEVRGGDGSPFEPDEFFTGFGTFGLRGIDSGLRLFDTGVSGGASNCHPVEGCPSFESATGMAMIGGTALLEGSRIQAGDPGLPSGFVGTALLLYTGNPVVTVFDTTFPVGQPPLQVVTGSLTTLPGSSRDFTATSPVRSGELRTLEFTGLPGEKVWVFAGASPADIAAPKFKGSLLVQQPSLLLLLGQIPPSGVLSLTSPASSFPAAFDALPVVVQAAFASGAGAILSEPVRMIVLQPAL